MSRVLETIHTFAEVIPRNLHVFKRVDTHELKLVAIVGIMDAAITADELGPRICEAMNAELLTRGSGDQSSNVP